MCWLVQTADTNPPEHQISAWALARNDRTPRGFNARQPAGSVGRIGVGRDANADRLVAARDSAAGSALRADPKHLSGARIGARRRFDYLINLFQTLFTLLTIIRASVVSARVRAARECCDASRPPSVATGGICPFAVSMEEPRLGPGSPNRLALSAGGGRLVDRARRLLDVPDVRNRPPGGCSPVRHGYDDVVSASAQIPLRAMW